MRLVREQLKPSTSTALELDWMRFVFHFRPGHELEGGRIITEWMRRVRVLCDEAAKRLGTPVMLGVRVPAATRDGRLLRAGCRGLGAGGLGGPGCPTPFWSATDFDAGR